MVTFQRTLGGVEFGGEGAGLWTHSLLLQLPHLVPGGGSDFSPFVLISQGSGKGPGRKEPRYRGEGGGGPDPAGGDEGHSQLGSLDLNPCGSQQREGDW